jgi:hypothetical protein
MIVLLSLLTAYYNFEWHVVDGKTTLVVKSNFPVPVLFHILVK